MSSRTEAIAPALSLALSPAESMRTAQRIAVVGANSTGKSWLTRQIAMVLRARGHRVHEVPDGLRQWCERHGCSPQAHELPAIARAQADTALACPHGIVLADTTPLMTAVYSDLVFGDASLHPLALEHQRLYAHTLLTGLDLNFAADGLQRDGPHAPGPMDTLLRQALDGAGIAYRVVYGHEQHRLNNALLALGLPPEDDAARQTRECAQHDLNRGRTPWTCEKCSDPECEHRLFTRLIQR